MHLVQPQTSSGSVTGLPGQKLGAGASARTTPEIFKHTATRKVNKYC
jgi:hypothetical protein